MLMDIDKITDIEVLRALAKQNRVKMKKDSFATDGTNYIFKEGYWYIAEQDQYGVTIYSDNMESIMFLNYDEVERFVCQ